MCRNRITDTLAIIPARGGSKRLPGKNIKILNGKPLIWYTIDAARNAFPDENICVSTDDEEIMKVVEDIGLKVPFMRPAELATDDAGSWGVVLHALDFFRRNGRVFKNVVLLQTTSPFRTGNHIIEGYEFFNSNYSKIDGVVSVKIAKANPYFTLFEKSDNGMLIRSKTSSFSSKQKSPVIYEINGAFYFIKTENFVGKIDLGNLEILPYLMSDEESIDVDTALDFYIAECILNRNGN